MTDFSKEIQNYTNYGIYIYKFDDVGNELVNPSSSIFQQVYFSLPFGNIVYNNSKIESFYDPTFTEFVPQPISNTVSVFPQEAIDQINAITSDNIRLQDQLLALVNTSEQDSSAADVSLVKNIIISLRIQLGQGTTTADFDTIFPYMPIPVELRDSTTGVQVVPSTAVSTIQPTIITQTSIVSNTEQNTITTTELGELTDSEIAAISTSTNTDQSSFTAGGGIKYVIPSPQFGSSVINGVTYYRIILYDPQAPINASIRWSMGTRLMGVELAWSQPTLDTNMPDFGNPIHGQYVNMTRDQYVSLADNPQATVVINGITYMGVDKYITGHWIMQEPYFHQNGQTYLQNYEHYNGPSIIGPHFTREEQIGLLGALGPA